jgi:hypothetical protein
MNQRRSLLAGIAALFSSGAGDDLLTMRPWGGKRKPRNNECPECGTMAAPYVRQTQSEWAHQNNVTCMSPPSSGGSTLSVCIGPSNEKFGPVQNLTRCMNCNAAFWQDDKS